jgi:hypothetical protein
MAKTETAKAKRRRRVKEVPLGHGVFARFKDGKPWRLELRQVPKVRALLGDKMMAGFVQAFHAAERHDVLWHFWHLSMNASDSSKHSTARKRDVNVLVLLMYSTLYEALTALRTLNGGGVRRILGKDHAAWNQLSALIGKWEKSDLLKLFRNQLGHHFGDFPFITRGLDKFAPGEPIVVFDTEPHAKGVAHSYPIAQEVLLRGAATEQQDYTAFAVEARSDLMSFGLLMQIVFCDVLRVHGVKLASQQELEESEARNPGGRRSPFVAARAR